VWQELIRQAACGALFAGLDRLLCVHPFAGSLHLLSEQLALTVAHGCPGHSYNVRLSCVLMHLRYAVQQSIHLPLFHLEARATWHF
jgi:hypothetical protein